MSIAHNVDLAQLEIECINRPQDTDLLMQLGCEYHKQGRFGDAIQTYESILNLDDSHTEANLNMIVVLIDLNEYDNAHKRFLHFTQRTAHTYAAAPQIAYHHHALAELYHHADQATLALQEAQKAIQLDSSSTATRLLLAKILMKQKDLSSAQQELQKILAEKPDHDEALTLSGLLHHKQGQSQKAYRCLLQARRVNHQHKAAKIMLESISV